MCLLCVCCVLLPSRLSLLQPLATSRFYVMRDEQGVYSEGNGAFPASQTSAVQLAGLGVVTDALEWSGVALASLFRQPHATALFVVDGIATSRCFGGQSARMPPPPPPPPVFSWHVSVFNMGRVCLYYLLVYPVFPCRGWGPFSTVHTHTHTHTHTHVAFPSLSKKSFSVDQVEFYDVMFVCVIYNACVCVCVCAEPSPLLDHRVV